MGRPEQLADVGRSDPALRGLNDHATTGSGPTRQFNARDSKLLVSLDSEPLFGREEHTAEGYNSCDSTEPILIALIRSPLCCLEHTKSISQRNVDTGGDQ